MKKFLLWLNKNLSNKTFLTISIVVYLFAFSMLLTQGLPNINFASSPDGQVAKTFTEQISNKRLFIIPIPNDIPKDFAEFVVPRSTRYQEVSNSYSMSSYYGLPIIYSFFHRFLPYQIIFISVALGVLFISFKIFFEISKSMRTSFYITFLVGLQPIFIFYAFRGFMHNLLFILFAFGVFILLILFKRNLNWVWLCLAGIVTGFAGSIRMNELIWFLPLLVLVSYLLQILNLKNTLKFSASMLVGLLPVILISKSISSSYVQYIELNEQIVSHVSLIDIIKKLILPFGFDFKSSFHLFFQNVQHILSFYLVVLFSILVTLKRLISKITIKKALTLLVGLSLFFYLVIYYGSSSFGVSNNSFSIGDSLTRYWLPLLFGFSVFTALLTRAFSKTMNEVFIVLVLCLTLGSYIFSDSGIFVNLFKDNIIAKERSISVAKVVPPDSIFLAGRADKFFLGSYVVGGTRMHTKRDIFVQELISLQTIRQVYYYHVEADISSHFTKDALEEAGVTFEYVAQFHDGGNAWEYLYKLDWPNKEQHVNE